MVLFLPSFLLLFSSFSLFFFSFFFLLSYSSPPILFTGSDPRHIRMVNEAKIRVFFFFFFLLFLFFFTMKFSLIIIYSYFPYSSLFFLLPKVGLKERNENNETVDAATSNRFQGFFVLSCLILFLHFSLFFKMKKQN